jgi:hypothetical protein
MDPLVARVLSIAIEAPLAAAIVLTLRWPARGGWPAAAGVAAVATLASHPLAWDAFFALWERLGYWPTSVVVEFGVIGFEALLYRWILAVGWIRALILSGLCNAASFAAGLAIGGLA